MASTIEFRTAYDDEEDEALIVPVVDGVPLTDRIHEFERAHRMERRGTSYGGIPTWLADDHYAPVSRRTPLLACECGEVGCWPLLADVIVTPTEVVWERFEQPYRTARDYSAFGPFRFDRVAYDAAFEAIGGA